MLVRLAAERSAGNVAMRVDRRHVRGAHATGRIALFVASDDERGAAEGPIDVSPRRRRRTFKPSLDVPECGPAEGARVDRNLIHCQELTRHVEDRLGTVRDAA